MLLLSLLLHFQTFKGTFHCILFGYYIMRCYKVMDEGQSRGTRWNLHSRRVQPYISHNTQHKYFPFHSLALCSFFLNWNSLWWLGDVFISIPVGCLKPSSSHYNGESVYVWPQLTIAFLCRGHPLSQGFSTCGPQPPGGLSRYCKWSPTPCIQ